LIVNVPDCLRPPGRLTIAEPGVRHARTPFSRHQEGQRADDY
jgi:hypothetical protein